MLIPMNVFLIGYRCTGKTTVGACLAQRLDWGFVDTDRKVVETTGVSIAQMVEANGWPFFREQECKALCAVSTVDNQVVATGGGIVLDDRNISIMRTSGKVVWLTASEKTIQARMLDDETTAGSRPSLTGEGLIAEVFSVLRARKPLYEKAADFQTATDRDSVTAVCERIITALGLATEAG
jgi:shikimate kinase